MYQVWRWDQCWGKHENFPTLPLLRGIILMPRPHPKPQNDIAVVNGARCSTFGQWSTVQHSSRKWKVQWFVHQGAPPPHTELGVQRVTSLGGGWVGRRNDNMKGCLPKGKCTLVCSHCATGPEQGDAGSHIHLPPTALYNINLPPWKQLAQQAHYYSIPIVWRNVVIRAVAIGCCAVIARVDHCWRVKFRVEHTIDKKKRQFHNFSMRFGGQVGEDHETLACVGGSGNLTEQ